MVRSLRRLGRIPGPEASLRQRVCQPGGRWHCPGQGRRRGYGRDREAVMAPRVCLRIAGRYPTLCTSTGALSGKRFVRRSSLGRHFRSHRHAMIGAVCPGPAARLDVDGRQRHPQLPAAGVRHRHPLHHLLRPVRRRGGLLATHPQVEESHWCRGQAPSHR